MKVIILESIYDDDTTGMCHAFPAGIGGDDSERTLCGRVYVDLHHVIEDGKIDCPYCIKIIEHCKKIDRRNVKK